MHQTVGPCKDVFSQRTRTAGVSTPGNLYRLAMYFSPVRENSTAISCITYRILGTRAVHSTPSPSQFLILALNPSYATNSTTPPASLILISAFRDTYRALTITGVLGRRPFPRTFVYPYPQLKKHSSKKSYKCKCINHRSSLIGLAKKLVTNFSGHECPKLIKIDRRFPDLEISDLRNLETVPCVHGNNACPLFQSTLDGICQSLFGDDVVHQRDRDLLDVYDVFRLDRDHD
jgi:hypothetical protein